MEKRDRGKQCQNKPLRPAIRVQVNNIEEFKVIMFKRIGSGVEMK